MPAASLHLSAECYGGLAQARFMRSLLALRDACRDRGVGLRLDLSGGEALVGRSRAGALARFLAGDATHLLFASADAGFAPDDVFGLLESGEGLSRLAPARPEEGPGLMLIARAAAEAVVATHPELQGGLGDLHGASQAPVPLVFESSIEPGTGRYLADLEAFEARWRALRP